MNGQDFDHLERAEHNKAALNQALRGSTEELRAYMADVKHRSNTTPSERARTLYAIYADRCLDELIRRGHKAGGKVGGRSRSEAKITATRKNAAIARAARKKRRYPLCPGYKNHSHRFNPDGRCYSPVCRQQYPDLLQDGKVDIYEPQDE